MPLGVAIGLVAALHDLHGEWYLIFFKSAMGCAPLAHSLPPCDHLCAAHLCYIGHGTHLLRGGPDDVPWVPLQLLWRTLTDENGTSVESVPVCEDIVNTAM
jgi:hypothetical protein